MEPSPHKTHIGIQVCIMVVKRNHISKHILKYHNSRDNGYIQIKKRIPKSNTVVSLLTRIII